MPDQPSNPTTGNGSGVSSAAFGGGCDGQKGDLSCHKRERNLGRKIIGVISDTHGLIRQEALEALKESELIIHAGDIGNPQVIESLRKIAPVVAVRGNMDQGPWAQFLPKYEIIQVAQTWFYVIHDINELDLDPAAAGFSAVIYGHSHHPSIQARKGVLLLNPGSAGPRRFKLPVNVALIFLKDGILEPRLIELAITTGVKSKEA
jgi:putative phosphoesterase